MRIRILALGLTAVLALTTGCAEPEADVDDTSPTLVEVERPVPRLGDVRLDDPAVPCGATDVATELPTEALVGSWDYISSTVNWDGTQSDTYTAGQLVISDDGRWDGSRSMGPNTGTATGPGDWSFDGRTLVLSYDDGGDSETYHGVLQTEPVNEATGLPFRMLTLESTYEDGSGCTVHLLAVSD